MVAVPEELKVDEILVMFPKPWWFLAHPDD
jgi:hypothetical protein